LIGVLGVNGVRGLYFEGAGVYSNISWRNADDADGLRPARIIAVCYATLKGYLLTLKGLLLRYKEHSAIKTRTKIVAKAAALIRVHPCQQTKIPAPSKYNPRPSI